MTEATELKPCPFCGGQGHVEFSRFELHQGYHVVCFGRKDCPLYCSKPYRAFDTEAEARDAWNTRALTQAGASLTAAQKAGPVMVEVDTEALSKMIYRNFTEAFDDGKSIKECCRLLAKSFAAIAQAQEPE
jgi:hypothetical protein